MEQPKGRETTIGNHKLVFLASIDPQLRRIRTLQSLTIKNDPTPLQTEQLAEQGYKNVNMTDSLSKLVLVSWAD